MGTQNAQGPDPARPSATRVWTVRRRIAGFAIALGGVPLLAWFLWRFHGPGTITIEVLAFQLLVVIVAVVGGSWPTLLAAISSAIALDLFFIEPHLTVAVTNPVHVIVLILHVAIATLVSYVAGRAARPARRPRRAPAESEQLQSEIEPLTASDRARGALLSALSHDLRRPLAAATAAVSGLRSAGDALSSEDRRELLATAEESLGSLTTLVTDLLDVSRLDAGVLTISTMPCDPMDVIVPALDELDLPAGAVEIERQHGATKMLADPVLLQRALVNLLTNALRYSPRTTPVTIATSAHDDRIEISVIDHGPGISADRRDGVFVPFQRHGDVDNTSGLGLGLALSRGFVEVMNGTLQPRDTPGGGLTMVVSLPAQPTGGAR